MIGALAGFLEGTVDYLTDTYYDHKFQNKANAITKIMEATMKNDHFMNIIIQKTVIEIIRD